MNERLDDFKSKYRGLRIEDLNEMNPSYSCVLCGKKECASFMKPKGSCNSHEIINESEWALFYDFEVPST